MSVAKYAFSTAADEVIDVFPHTRPEISEPDLMKCMIEVKMFTNRISVKCREYDVPKL
jgi:hypothetical protein